MADLFRNVSILFIEPDVFKCFSLEDRLVRHEYQEVR